jgi:hypothetical protein
MGVPNDGVGGAQVAAMGSSAAATAGIVLMHLETDASRKRGMLNVNFKNVENVVL